MEINMEKEYLAQTQTGPRAFLYKDAKAWESKGDVLMVGLSFSMTKYSGPGEYNTAIWTAMKNDRDRAEGAQREQQRSGKLFVFVQWEIADAATSVGARLERDHVCEPHTFTPEHILQPRKIMERLSAAKLKSASALGILATKLDELLKATGVGNIEELAKEKEESNLRRRLAANFNGLVAKQDFWEGFHDRVTLNDLLRPKPGRTWRERRDLPKPEPTTRFGKYQRGRLNAFVMEALFGDDIVKPTDYVTTRSVLDAMMAQAQQERFIPDRIFIYAHADHALRVRWSLLERIWSSTHETEWKPDWLLPAEDVVIRGGADGWVLTDTAQDSTDNAQEWTDRAANWKDYNRV